MKAPEVGRWSWLIWVSPAQKPQGPQRREAEGSGALRTEDRTEAEDRGQGSEWLKKGAVS